MKDATVDGPLRDACFECAGRVAKGKDNYQFDSPRDALAAVVKLGLPSPKEIPFESRSCYLKLYQRQLVLRFKRYEDDHRPADFVLDGNWWEQVIGKLPRERAQRTDVLLFNDSLRCLESEDAKPLGFAAMSEYGHWMFKKMSSAKMILQAMGYTKSEAECILGGLERDPWKMVSLPFEPEYPGDRRWNFKAPQWAFKPAPGPHLHWDRVCDHIGNDLTPYLASLPWAQEAGIKTGGDYIRAVIAAILREPREPTPYLFLFGPENSGKSILHEAISVLVTKGVVAADRALTSDKNGELDGAILCVVEEKDIRLPGVLERIKAAVTAIMLPIRAMHRDVYHVPNYTHWVQMSNDKNACPKFPGDTRIQPIYVGPLTDEIGKPLLLAKLREEAPAFLHTVANLKLPEATGRLRIPLVETEHSKRLEESNTPPGVLGIIDLIKQKRVWRGTAPQLHKAVPEAPGDFRTLKRMLESNQFALKRGGVIFEESRHDSKHKGAKAFVLKAA